MAVTYLEQMKSDVLDYIEENGVRVTEQNRGEIAERLNDDLWAEDSVTGNASGSYTFNSNRAHEYIMEDGEQYIHDVINEFGIEADTIVKHLFDWEYWDVSIRCYLLGQAIEAALDEVEKGEEP